MTKFKIPYWKPDSNQPEYIVKQEIVEFITELVKSAEGEKDKNFIIKNYCEVIYSFIKEGIDYREDEISDLKDQIWDLEAKIDELEIEIEELQ